MRFYLVPVETFGNQRGPKYFHARFRGDVAPASQFEAIRWQARDYGNEPSMLLAADMSDLDNATLTAFADVTKFADDLDQQVGAQLAAIQNALEALNLPAQMVTANTTHRQVVRGIMGCFAVAQCMQGKGFRVFGGALTLATTLSSLSVPARQALQSCAQELGYDQTGITLASTIRQVLTLIVQQAAPSPMMGVTV